jgi:hypothetical protein
MLKNLMSILLVATGVLHLVVAAVGAPADLQLPLAVFGALYSALGVWLRRGGKPAVITSVAAATTGIVLGGANYIQNGGPMTLPVMFLIDVLVIGAGALWLMKSGKAA